MSPYFKVRASKCLQSEDINNLQQLRRASHSSASLLLCFFASFATNDFTSSTFINDEAVYKLAAVLLTVPYIISVYLLYMCVFCGLFGVDLSYFRISNTIFNFQINLNKKQYDLYKIPTKQQKHTTTHRIQPKYNQK